MNVKSSDDENDVRLPSLKVGETLTLVPPNVKAEKKETKPPPRYGEGSLVKELERRNIGRPSTYADIIEKIKSRSYVELKGKIYHSTELGRKVIDNLVKHFKFMNYDYTADMELQLDKIAEGKLKYVTMLDTFFNPFQKELKIAYLDNEKDYGFNCPKCNKYLQLKHGKFGYYLSCPGYPECKTTMSCDLEDGKPVIKADKINIVDGVECPECKSGMSKRDGKFGPFYSCSKYPKCNSKRKVPSGLKCNKCNSDMYWTVFDNVPKLACTGYPNCKNIMEAPVGAKIPDWINPEDLRNKKQKKSIQKVLNVERR
jgi:DNA topoisomerase-1